MIGVYELNIARQVIRAGGRIFRTLNANKFKYCSKIMTPIEILCVKNWNTAIISFFARIHLQNLIGYFLTVAIKRKTELRKSKNITAKAIQNGPHLDFL